MPGMYPALLLLYTVAVSIVIGLENTDSELQRGDLGDFPQ